MHYHKYVDKGSSDPRCRNYHIYICNICNHEATFSDNPNFDKRNRKCPRCGVVDDVDVLHYYKNKRIELKDKIKKLEDELFKVDSKIQIITLTTEEKHGNIPNIVSWNFIS